MLSTLSQNPGSEKHLVPEAEKVELYKAIILNASRPSEHPRVRGKNVKTFRWDHRLQIVAVISHIQRFGCQPEKTT